MSTIDGIEFITAHWCKACQPVKAEVTTLCQNTGTPLTVKQLDDLTLDEQGRIKQLPTVLVHMNDGSVLTYTRGTMEQLETLVLADSLRRPADF